MDMLVNDLSLHGQFSDLMSFKASIGRIMSVRNILRKFGRDLRCHRGFFNASVTDSMLLPQALQILSVDERRAVTQWLTNSGPFWEDDRQHSSDHFLICNDAIVTDSAVGEAAYCGLVGLETAVVSVAPSSWVFTPLQVSLMIEEGEESTSEIDNYWAVEAVEDALRDVPTQLDSWKDLETAAISSCQHLSFLEGAFRAQRSHPYNLGVAQKILLRLRILDSLQSSFDDNGARTKEGHAIYQTYFTGEKAWFSDSSDTEKTEFENELTFVNPDNASEVLSCSWHGKINTPKLRIHFSWPIRADQKCYVVYVGPKLTKR